MNERFLHRDVRDVLTSGPQTAPTAVVDRAIAEASRTRQRRPRFHRFDPRAWPAARAAIAATAFQPAGSRMSPTTRVSLVAATAVLSAALIGGVLTLGGGLVPPSSTEGIRGHVGSVDVKSLAIRAGHVGLVVGGKAQATVWPEATRWLGERSRTNDDGRGLRARDFVAHERGAVAHEPAQ